MQWPSSMRDNIRKHFSIRLLTLAAAVSEAALSSCSSKNGSMESDKKTLDHYGFWTHFTSTPCTTIQALN